MHIYQNVKLAQTRVKLTKLLTKILFVSNVHFIPARSFLVHVQKI